MTIPGVNELPQRGAWLVRIGAILAAGVSVPLAMLSLAFGAGALATRHFIVGATLLIVSTALWWLLNWLQTKYVNSFPFRERTIGKVLLHFRTGVVAVLFLQFAAFTWFVIANSD